MEIKKDSLIINKTRKYLYPIINYYGDKFVGIMNSLNKAGIGIGDMILERSGITHERHLFILINLKKTYLSGVNFPEVLNLLREHHSYEDDYRYDLTGKYHMIVIKIPDKYISSFENFKQSQFSKMFSEEEIDLLFKNKIKNDDYQKQINDIKSILKKDVEYQKEFRKLISQKFKMKLEEIHPDALTGELDFNIKNKEEKFNYKIVGE
jgi:hypothetical protein